MTVDDMFKESWMTIGPFTMLSSSQVFVGGSDRPFNLKGADNDTRNFVGCMKKVNREALNLVTNLSYSHF